MTEEEVMAVEDARCAAMVDRDLRALDLLFDDGLVWIHSSGTIEDKAGFIARLGEGADRYLAISRAEARVRLVGEVAIVTGIAEMEALVQGKAKSLRNRFTNIWALGSQGPRLVSCQSTKIG